MPWDIGSAKCQSGAPSCPQESPQERGSPLPVLHPVIAPSPRRERGRHICSVSRKLSLGEVPRVPTQNPEGGGLGWSELNFLSI